MARIIDVMKRLLLILACLLPQALRAQQAMFENRPAVAPAAAPGNNNSFTLTPNVGYLTNGLIEWNRFNDPSGTTIAADASGNGNTVPLLGSPALNGSYVTLNGSSQYGDASANRLSSLDYSDMSICVWVNKNGSSFKGIVDNSFNISGYGYGGWGLWVLANGSLDWWLEQGQDIYDLGPQTITNGQWTFVTVVWHPGSHRVDFYLNGALNSSVGNGGPNQGASGVADLEIGNLQNNSSGGAYAFDGLIHDVGIYNRALSAAEVYSNYVNSALLTTNVVTVTNCTTCGNTNTNTIVSSNALTSYLLNGLVQWNKLNDPNGTAIAADASGNGNTLPLFGAPGLNGSYMTLNGSSQYGDAGSNQLASLDVHDKTICAWVNKTGISFKGILDKHYSFASGAYGGWGLWVLGTSNVLDWWVQNGEDLTDAGYQTITLGQWTFVTVVWHQATDKADFYLNGVLNSTVQNGAAQERQSFTADLEVGNLGNDLNGGQFAFDGSMHDIGIYNRALSAAEVASNYLTSEATTNVTLPDLLYYKMTEYPVTNPPIILADSSSRGTTTGAIWLAYPTTLQWFTNQASIPHSAVHFNGVSTYIDTSNSVLFNFTTNLFTLNMWLCPLTADGYVMQNGYPLTNGWSLRVGDTYQLYFGTESNGVESLISTGTGAANVNRYTMVTIVRSSVTNAQIYLNGVQTATSGSINIPAPSTNSLWFGTDRVGGHWMDGEIWQPQIWGRALSPGEVANLFLEQQGGSPWP